MVVIDPLVLATDDEVLSFLDERRSGRQVVVLLTASWHERSTQLVRRRYAASVWASEKAARAVSCEVTHRIREDVTLPAGILAFPVRGVEEAEIAYYLPADRALVVAEVFIGTAEGLRVCIAPNVYSIEEWRDSIARLVELEVDCVLPSHGPPVLTSGNEAMVDALAKPEWNSERAEPAR